MKSQMKAKIKSDLVLYDAVSDLYYAAVWHADRPVDEQALWTAVRDAAGLEPGNSPKGLPFEGIRIQFDLTRIRLLGGKVRDKLGDDFTSEKARAFLLLYGPELQDKIDTTVRQFLEEKLS